MNKRLIPFLIVVAVFVLVLIALLTLASPPSNELVWECSTGEMILPNGLPDFERKTVTPDTVFETHDFSTEDHALVIYTVGKVDPELVEVSRYFFERYMEFLYSMYNKHGLSTENIAQWETPDIAVTLWEETLSARPMFEDDSGIMPLNPDMRVPDQNGFPVEITDGETLLAAKDIFWDYIQGNVLAIGAVSIEGDMVGIAVDLQGCRHPAVKYAIENPSDVFILESNLINEVSGTYNVWARLNDKENYHVIADDLLEKHGFTETCGTPEHLMDGIYQTRPSPRLCKRSMKHG
ncbi:hypothetical protein JW710_03765 [Candidatus Dojkabacteria bacterium]|nr:hypothetical protein [Candidatus Dojkabacteria bacterium]